MDKVSKIIENPAPLLLQIGVLVQIIVEPQQLQEANVQFVAGSRSILRGKKIVFLNQNA